MRSLYPFTLCALSLSKMKISLAIRTTFSQINGFYSSSSFIQEENLNSEQTNAEQEKERIVDNRTK